MQRGAWFSLAGLAVLLAVAGCGRSFLQYGERASWRHQAEVNCLKSGAVKIGAGVVQISPIEGPGMCGADFPLKVSALGEGNPAIGYAGEEIRPPGSIPRASMPNWPPPQPAYAPPPSRPVPVQPVQSAPIEGQGMRWVPGPPGIEAPQSIAPAGQPMSISPPGMAPPEPSRVEPEPEADEPDDIPDDAIVPGRGKLSPPRTQPAYNAPVYQPPPERPALGPQRPQGPLPAPVLKPTATLACPIVSALDRWVSGGVQPAAMRWFNSPVVEIKQISAYSCRGMVGAGTNHISEHAFGNALDIAGFTLADGRKISVKDGWHGSPEEQGFLHDVQLYACDIFNTVLSPGYNAAHYNHIHVDLMRRAPGRRPCRPNAVPGEIVAAKARAVYAARARGDHTGSIKAPISIGTLIKGLPEAAPGEDGFVADEDDETTGSIPEPEAPKKSKSGGWFGNWFGGSSQSAQKKALQDRATSSY
jgi:hypothetical protein